MDFSLTYKKVGLSVGIAAMTFFCAPNLFAQNGGFAGASNRLGYSARGMAMSNAMAAVTSEGAFSYYNPAQAALLLESKQTDLTVGALKYDRVFQSSGIQFQLPPTAGLALNIIRTGVNDIDARTSSGYPLDRFDASEYQFSGAFGLRFSEKFSGGIGLKFSLANYHPQLDHASSFGIDIGLLYQTDAKFNFSLALKDLFANYSWNAQNLYNLDQSRDVVNQFPTRIISGVSYQVRDLTFSTDMEVQVYNSEIERSEVVIINGSPVYTSTTEEMQTSSFQFRMGGSWRAHERFTLRGGWRLPDAAQVESWTLSSGFSIHLPFDIFSPSFDYAFVMEPYRISNMHVFSLRLNL